MRYLNPLTVMGVALTFLAALILFGERAAWMLMVVGICAIIAGIIEARKS